MRQKKQTARPAIKKDVHSIVENLLSEHTGYVLVTCHPKGASKLAIEFSYAGDPDLAELMLDGALKQFEDQQLAEQA